MMNFGIIWFVSNTATGLGFFNTGIDILNTNKNYWFWAFFHFLNPSGFFFGLLGLFLGSRSGSKTFLEPTNVDYQFLFWKYSPIFLFFIRPNFGPFFAFFGLFGAIFWVGVSSKNFFGTCLHRLTNQYCQTLARPKFKWAWLVSMLIAIQPL